MDQIITFEFEGKRYSAPGDAAREGIIVLPDGRVLKVYSWTEYPAWKPMRMRVLADVKATELLKEEPVSR